jgi:hypothetical protein
VVEASPRGDASTTPPSLKKRKALSYRTNERLTYVNEETGLGVTGIVEQALNEYFAFLTIPEDAVPPLSPDGTRPKRERTMKKRTRRTAKEIDDIAIAPRLSSPGKPTTGSPSPP